jgi:hypothetical protein
VAVAIDGIRDTSDSFLVAIIAGNQGRSGIAFLVILLGCVGAISSVGKYFGIIAGSFTASRLFDGLGSGSLRRQFVAGQFELHADILEVAQFG